MSHFASPLRTEYPEGSARDRIVISPLTYVFGEGEDAWVITVPAGFITDFASVPRFIWWLIPPDGDHSPAAVVHDYLYNRVIGGRCERLGADAVFQDAMKTLGVPWAKRKVMFWAVRIFGGLHMALTSKKGK